MNDLLRERLELETKWLTDLNATEEDRQRYLEADRRCRERGCCRKRSLNRGQKLRTEIRGNREVQVPDDSDRARLYEQAFRAVVLSLRSFDPSLANYHESALKAALKDQ